jgi:hypothetical protein
MLKTYLTLAVVVLMAITSLGIFGFLTSAYQQSHVKVEMIDAKKESILSNKETLENENINLIKRIETLNQVRLVQEQRVKDSGNYKVPREQAYEAINKANQEINQSQDRIKQISEEINKLNQELINLKYEESKSSDIGTLKFVAELFNTEISTIVKWFTIILVLVFDPLAVSLVLAYNNIIFNKKKESKIIEDKLENSLSEKIIKRIKKPFKVKYQDK